MYLHSATFQPGQLSGPLRAELEKGRTRPGQALVYQVTEIDLPSGTRGYASTGVPWPGMRYQARVVTGGWGMVASSADIRTGALGAMETTLLITEDAAREFAVEVATYGARAIYGSAVRQRLISPAVSDADAYTMFTGKLRAWPQTAPLVRELRFGVDDDALQHGSIPDVPITRALFVNAHASALGTYVQTILGVHSSQGTTATGAVALPCIDTITFLYVVSLGVVTVQNVMADGVIVSSSSYSLTYPVFGGRRYTCVKFTASQADKTITADVTGLTDNPDGGGTLIGNRADQLKWCLANLVYSKWDGRSAYAAPGSVAPVDLGSFRDAAQFLDDHPGYEGSRVIGGDAAQTRAYDLVSEMASSAGLCAYWTPQGKLALRPNDYRPLADPYSSEQWIMPTDDLAVFSAPDQSDQVISRVALKYLYLMADGQYVNEMPVEDLGVGIDAADPREDRWSKAAVA